MPALKSLQLLEINIISAQDLEPMSSKKMKTYATAWVHPNRKLSTRIDTEGHINPNWNDKFVFRVDEEFLKMDTSAVMIEIYSTGRGGWFNKDVLVGTVRVLVGNLILPQATPNHRSSHQIGMRFVALQVRRPSGRPQGILNLGVSLLDSTMKSMPLYSQQSASAVGFHNLLEEDHDDNKPDQTNNRLQPLSVKPILRRSRSERSMTFDKMSSVAASSMVAFPGDRKQAISLLSSKSSEPFPLKIKGNKKGKASSVISGAELKEEKKRKGSSVLSDSIVSKSSTKNNIIFDKPIPITIGPNNKIKILNDKPSTKQLLEEKKNIKPISKYNGYGYEYGGGPKTNNKLSLAPAGSVLDSEIGPSPSEVAAAFAQRRYPLDDTRSSMLDGWSVDQSVEGLRSKLERWRTELPPLYDRGTTTLSSSSFRSTSTRRHSVGGETGLFSCFGNIYGYECQCICGKPPSSSDSTPDYRFPSP